jgi:hypothetical protein
MLEVIDVVNERGHEENIPTEVTRVVEVVIEGELDVVAAEVVTEVAWMNGGRVIDVTWPLIVTG